MRKPVEIFCCYAHEDESLLLKLKTHLNPLQREGLITVQSDIDISPGREWEKEISQHLNTAQIILLIISPDFIASENCYSIEMRRAIERHDHGEVRVIPIILRRVSWQRAPFGKLQVLPRDAHPLTSSHWHNPDDAFFDVVEGIRKVVEELTKAEQTERNSIPHKEQRNSTSMPPGTLLLQYTGHSGDVMSVAWSPDGQRIASGSSDKTVQVWNPDNGMHIYTYKGHVDYVKLVAWSPDGQRIASVSRDGTVQVWNPDDREQSFTFIASGPIAWSPDGQRIASSSSDSTVRVWSAG